MRRILALLALLCLSPVALLAASAPPLQIIAGQIEQMQAGNTLAAPGPVSITSSSATPLSVNLTSASGTSVVESFKLNGNEGDSNYQRDDVLTHAGGVWEWTSTFKDSTYVSGPTSYAGVIVSGCANVAGVLSDTCSLSFAALAPGAYYGGASGAAPCVASYVSGTLGYGSYVGNLNLVLNGVSSSGACPSPANPQSWPDRITAVGSGYHVGDVLTGVNVGGTASVNTPLSLTVLLTNNAGGAGIGGVVLAQITANGLYTGYGSQTGFTFTGGSGAGFTLGTLTSADDLWVTGIPLPGLVLEPNTPNGTAGYVAITQGYSLAMGSTKTIDVNRNIFVGSGSDISWGGDTGLSRDSAGVLDLGNGTQGDKSGTLQLTGLVGAGGAYETGIYNDGSFTAEFLGNGTYSGVISNQDGIIITDTLSGNSPSGAYTAITAFPTLSAGALSSFSGSTSTAILTGSATATTAKGAFGEVLNQGSGTVGTAYGVTGECIQQSTGTTTTCYDFYAIRGATSSATIGTSYAYEDAADTGAGTYTTEWGYHQTATNHPNLFASTTQFTKSVQLAVTTVSSLPTCNAGAEGTIEGVTDATSTTFHAALAGSGANHVMAYCSGSGGWVVGG